LGRAQIADEAQLALVEANQKTASLEMEVERLNNDIQMHQLQLQTLEVNLFHGRFPSPFASSTFTITMCRERSQRRTRP
jgi:hypothetical protein